MYICLRYLVYIVLCKKRAGCFLDQFVVQCFFSGLAKRRTPEFPSILTTLHVFTSMHRKKLWCSGRSKKFCDAEGHHCHWLTYNV